MKTKSFRGLFPRPFISFDRSSQMRRHSKWPNSGWPLMRKSGALLEGECRQ